MILDVQDILKIEGARIPVSGTLGSVKDLDNGDMQFSEISFSGELENIGGVLAFSATVEGRFTVPCARCMKLTEQAFKVQVNETLAKEDADLQNRDEVIPFTGTSIDVLDVVRPGILLALASKYVCRPDCKGLCMHCGADLNEAPCNCKDDDIDPRLAGLAKLLQ